MKIIGITGRAGAGKDTVGSMLVYEHGFHRLALADPIKRGLEAMFGFGATIWDDREAKERPVAQHCDVTLPLDVTFRRLAQTLGTEWGRDMIASDVWLRCAEARIRQIKAERFPYHAKGVVITDVRFDNEADFIHEMGGTVVRIERGVGDVAAHISEAGVSERKVDVTIWNNHTIEDLRTIVREYMTLFDAGTLAP